ncbi:hypothetical protein [Hymenobacter convexus]|uniref:hypothetical protein n=1 Tax=Hymenobacter sp. CA1UV-4 TaxID=3063782 RepID=UPI002712684A|nr:hypothetical protein [Hymenobacter sp. CA1UV-4]MDO7852550.1 hypothetical protein [Hymenobacter sp. CA1UV-4]
MRQLWRKLSDNAALLVIVPVVLLFAIVIIPFIPFLLLHSYFNDKQFEKEYTSFLARMNGACFFCYNSRKSSVEFARDVIVPELGPAVHVVFVNGKRVDFGDDSKFISTMLYRIEARKGFPYLLKIEGRKVHDLSVNNQFYSIMIGRKSIAPLLQRINSFFENTAN